MSPRPRRSSPPERAPPSRSLHNEPSVEQPLAAASGGNAKDKKKNDKKREGPTSAHHIVGGPRNKHGTRISKRVLCTRCGKNDYVQFVPQDKSKVLCRDCAVQILRTYEEGAHIRMETRTVACNLCGTPFGMPITAVDDGDPLCINCLRGFTTWQGSIDAPFAERQNTVVETRSSGALLRKKKKHE